MTRANHYPKKGREEMAISERLAARECAESLKRTAGDYYGKIYALRII